MAVSKRTRYEVLRRDSHTCRYCGAKAPDVKLHVDHVTPTALGGTDDPSNLVAACADCNSGKASTSPDEDLVADIDEKAAMWAQARKVAIKQYRANRKQVDRACSGVINAWEMWDREFRYLPPNYPSTIEGWMRQGLSAEDVLDCYYIAISAHQISAAVTWQYMCGVARNRIAEIDQMTERLLAVGDK